ncbi:MAG: type II 3-dehydroquinate dehydratase, partial [bacterium]|nr:type II 3-dehydroquinate dehydratase [bacterium]
VIHGPNMNLLGKREKVIYGLSTLAEINLALNVTAQELGLELEIMQSNSEGEIINAIHSCIGKCDAIIINPAAYTHYSYAIRDAIAAVGLPAIEVQMSNVAAREGFRHKSVLAPVVIGSISGFGAMSYLLALRAIAGTIASGPAFNV